MRFLFILFFCLSFAFTHAQTEFEAHENGLIYSPEAMSKLSEIVAMENQQFRVCDLSKDFKSNLQTTGYVLKVSDKHRKDLARDVKASIPLSDFLEKYKVELGDKQLMVLSEYEGYDGEMISELNTYPAENSFYISKDEIQPGKGNPWMMRDTYGGKIRLLYMERPMTTSKVPYKYARMIQYSECLVDTTATIHPKGAKESYFNFSNKGKKLKQGQLIQEISSKFGKEEPEPKYGNMGEYEAYQEDLKAYETEMFAFAKRELMGNADFDQLLKESYEEALELKMSSETYERYVAGLLSKKEALQLKRNRIVVGSCSQDSSPRYHAMDIAQLSAESYSWEIFLRAHLDIMNDNFRRASDGSYAWGRRHTYIKELEELDINVPDLLLGITLRTSNPSKNHYYGSIRRVGRAIAESKDLDVFKTEILNAVGNEELDDYNRLMFFYTYASLQYNLDMNQEKEFNKTKVEGVRDLLPKHLRTIEY
ncbi:hypothetical protein POV27_01215 [Aureisphaera galaxeae]|uniref:hypothetical protein n=1 Tax=Aureisphaera galaxeae TaxID=1538023 RepID=UPI002350CEEA|nr:hypothetical protein [Aureisphaera galaxeae]MDC8002657.1 hypothetical protein [Aureisphaera galaxeae]